MADIDDGKLIIRNNIYCKLTERWGLASEEFFPKLFDHLI